MTKRIPVSAEKNIWFDSQQVDNTDLTLEQDYNDTTTSAIINNHIGSGVLPEVLVQNILFDSDVADGFLDGVAVSAQNQPADSNFGNQLEIALSNSEVGGKKTVKLCVIGLDFQSNLQYETFVFRANETQISKKHFAYISVLLFNDLYGDPNLSLNLGGTLTIKEARPLSLSRSPIMIAQDVQPNLFFRDFFVSGFASLNALLQSALPLYNIDTLDIATGNLDTKTLLKNDITTHIGEKFIATTDNIQKLTLLLSVRNLDIGFEDELDWGGDLIISVYPLQTTLDCPTDIAPSLAIDFSPSNIPIAQVSVTYSTLQDRGIVLDSVPQPVDFIFSNSSLASSGALTIGANYAFTIKRGGSANKCDILIDSGGNKIDDSRITIFTGSLWVDLPDEQLWFQLWTDSAKISDGQAYESGHGILLPKTIEDSTTLATVDYCKDNIIFYGNDVFRAVVSAGVEESTPVPDQRTGNPVLTRQQFIPNIDLLNTIDLASIEEASEPLIIGAISDKNKKYFDPGSSTINANLYSATLVNNELLIRVVDDSTDTSRYDTSVSSLRSSLLNGDFVGAQIFPNGNTTGTFYRIANAQLCTYIVGDVNGDGIVDQSDLDILNTYIGEDLTTGRPKQSTVTTDGYTTTFTNGYLTETVPFSDAFSISFQLVDPLTDNVVDSGSDGILVAHPTDDRLAQFTSSAVNFSSIIGISSYKLVITTAFPDANYGGFDITGLDTLTDVITIRKTLLTGDVIAEMFRADIDGDFNITSNDGYLLGCYVDRLQLSVLPTPPYPAPTTNAYDKIGTTFNVIRFKLEEFIDRADDYSSLIFGRPTEIHVAPDIFTSDAYFWGHDFTSSPVPIVIEKQLVWNENLIVTNTAPKLVPSVFTSNSGFAVNSCSIDGVTCNVYGEPPDFDPGRIDLFAPNNLIIGDGGEIQRPDGYFYKVDFEIGTIVLEIPDGLFDSEKTIDILDDFIADYTGGGITRLGFPAMKFADCSYVASDAIEKDQIRFSVSVQSYSPIIAIDQIIADGYESRMGVSFDYTTGLLRLNFSNLYQDSVLETLSTKVQINVFLKKGGFNNESLFVDSTKVQNMLNLISVFSGAEAGPSALVDLSADVTDVLPILHGGTGLNAVGSYGTVLTSNGSGVSYQFINTLPYVKAFSVGSADADIIPKTDGYGFLDPSFYYKNPVFISAISGRFAHDNDDVTPLAAGAFTFRFDSFILEGLDSIKLECILETTNAAKVAELQLYNVDTTTYLTINSPSTKITTTNTTATYFISDDIKSLLLEGATDYVYEIHLSLNPSDVGVSYAVCKMARLVLTYNNLTLNSSSEIAPPAAHSYNFVPFLPSPTPS